MISAVSGAENPESEEFRELLVRWFQFGVFSPICRLHGHRRPSGTLPEVVDSGMFDFNTCGPNEVWSYGEKNYGILKELLMLRERMRPYVEETAAEASETGLPMLRTLFFNYPEDENCWETEDEIMLGRDLGSTGHVSGDDFQRGISAKRRQMDRLL